jgi:hypothetical protein
MSEICLTVHLNEVLQWFPTVSNIYYWNMLSLIAKLLKQNINNLQTITEPFFRLHIHFIGHRGSDAGHHEMQYGKLWTTVWLPVIIIITGLHNVTVGQKIQFSIPSTNYTCSEWCCQQFYDAQHSTSVMLCYCKRETEL